MVTHEARPYPDWSPVYRAVIYRALFDALGFTGLNSRDTIDEHEEAVREAREWFYEGGEDFQYACLVADLDAENIRRIALRTIYAKQSGDYSKVAPFWAKAFKRNRAPALSWLQKQLVAVPVDGELEGD